MKEFMREWIRLAKTKMNEGRFCMLVNVYLRRRGEFLC